jgi:hypothetical protein
VLFFDPAARACEAALVLDCHSSPVVSLQFIAGTMPRLVTVALSGSIKVWMIPSLALVRDDRLPCIAHCATIMTPSRYGMCGDIFLKQN